MSKDAVRLRVLLLTEDRAKDAVATLQAAARELFLLVDPLLQTHRLRFEPPDGATSIMMGANAWRSTSKWDYDKVVRLCRTIATKLMLENTLVLFHFDGDKPWRERADCDTARQFERKIASAVKMHLRDALSRASTVDDVDREVENRFARLVTVVPFYSMEAWAYQNAREAVRDCPHCGESAGCEHLKRMMEWEAHRELLDEVEKPKDQFCVGSSKNLRLMSTAYPAREVEAVGKSLAAVACALRSSRQVVSALALTHA